MNSTTRHPQADQIARVLARRMLKSKPRSSIDFRNPEIVGPFYERLCRRLPADASAVLIEAEITRRFRGLLKESRRADSFDRHCTSIEDLLDEAD